MSRAVGFMVFIGFLWVCYSKSPRLVVESLPLVPQANSTSNSTSNTSNTTNFNSTMCTFPRSIPTEKRRVELFIMSKCPYGSDAILNFGPVVEKIGAAMNFTIDFIGSEDGNGFHSLHGEEEVEGDIWMLCAINLFNANYRYMPFLMCMSQDYASIPYNAEECITATGLNQSLLRECFNGEEGSRLLSASFRKAHDLEVTSSPTIILSGSRYKGSRDSESLFDSICYNEDDDDGGLDSNYFWLMIILGGCALAVLGAGFFVGMVTYHYCRNVSYKWISIINAPSVNDSLSFGTKIRESLHNINSSEVSAEERLQGEENDSLLPRDGFRRWKSSLQ